MKKTNTYRNLKIYKIAFHLLMNSYELVSKIKGDNGQPVRQGLINAVQMTSVRIAEGWCRRKRPGAFEEHLDDASTALAEARLWLMVGLEHKHIDQLEYKKMSHMMNYLGEEMELLKMQWVVAK